MIEAYLVEEHIPKCTGRFISNIMLIIIYLFTFYCTYSEKIMGGPNAHIYK